MRPGLARPYQLAARRLAFAPGEESVHFTDFHVARSCTPTRGGLLTGMDALRNGASSPTGQRTLLKRDVQTMGEMLLENGYRTDLFGRWRPGGNFVDFRPRERGFERAICCLRGGLQSHPNYRKSDLFDDYVYDHGEIRQFAGCATDVWFELGTEFVKEREQAKPIRRHGS